MAVLFTALSSGDWDLGCSCCNCCSGFGVDRRMNVGSSIREAIRSGTRSGEADRELTVYSASDETRRCREARSGEGERERTGYSVAGVARRRREVVGCGAWMVDAGNSSVTMVVGTIAGPVLTLEGRICSKPCARATCSISLKYWNKESNSEQMAADDGM